MKPYPSPPSRFRLADDRAELARLKRLTGLDYAQVPESLLQPLQDRKEEDAADARPVTLTAPR